MLAPIAIGAQKVGVPSPPAVPGYWIVVLDSSSLAVVYNQLQTSYDTAPNLGQYNSDGYILIVAAVAQTLNLLPQGDFAAFLNANGADTQLARLEQINDQFGCGTVGNFSYILVSVLGDQSGTPGIEASSIDYANNQGAILTASLIGTVINGQTVYSPFILE
jgi:hypothetical protein